MRLPLSSTRTGTRGHGPSGAILIWRATDGASGSSGGTSACSASEHVRTMPVRVTKSSASGYPVNPASPVTVARAIQVVTSRSNVGAYWQEVRIRKIDHSFRVTLTRLIADSLGL